MQDRWNKFRNKQNHPIWKSGWRSFW